MPEYSKAVKRKMNELLTLAWERELSEHLQALSGKFDEWKNKKINVWDLADHIHKFHNGPSRDLYNLYNDKMEVPVIARAVAKKLLLREEIPDNIYELIETCLSMFEEETK
jgi:hypothetical protein